MKKRFLISKWKGFLFAVLWTISFGLFAQHITVNGSVTDVTGMSVIGATIMVEQNSSIGTVTDIDGNYTLNNVPSDASLQFSYVGMETQIVEVNGRTNINVVMASDTELLDELVVVGYGTMQKKQVTSSITSLSASDLPKGVGGSSIANALQGKVAGLVMSGTASPNSGNTFQLRGMASINTSRAPLIVIDGMPGGDIRLSLIHI